MALAVRTGSGDHLPDGRIRVNKLQLDLWMRLGKHSGLVSKAHPHCSAVFVLT
jgi:hypothetical protein